MESNYANALGFYWNYKNNTSINDGHWSNTWSTSLLNRTNLNTNFINNIGTKWVDKIIEATWKVGGNTNDKLSKQAASTAYQNEILHPVTTNSIDNQTEYNAKIGLMYVSDYMYATPQNKWTLVGYYKDDFTKDYRTGRKEDWMYMGLYEWTITRQSDQTYRVFWIGHIGYLITNGAEGYGAVRPTFYLSNSVSYFSGSGTKTDPIILGD